MDHKTYLKQLIADGKIAEVIKQLLDATEKNGQNELHNDLIILSARYNAQASAKRNGLTSNEAYNIQINSINHSLMYIMDEYESIPGDFSSAPGNKITAKSDSVHPTTQTGDVLFLSYSRQDQVLARKIRIYLEQAGFTVIQDDSHLMAGESIQAFIQRSILESRATISLVSSRSLLSVWVAHESMSTFYAEKLSNKKYIAVFEDRAFFSRSFVDDAFDTIEAEIKDISDSIQRRLSKGRNITDLQEELLRYKDLEHNLPNIVHRLKEHLSIDIGENTFEEGMRKVLDTLRSES
ncbi:MAG: TIR domain-containing protein [Saprospiraceae bacterium]|nr:toll/interleukin-1 receptor domain-containing protein [Lewinella sp.]